MDQYVTGLSRMAVLAYCQLAAADVNAATATEGSNESKATPAGDTANAARLHLARWHVRTVDYLPRCVCEKHLFKTSRCMCSFFFFFVRIPSEVVNG